MGIKLTTSIVLSLLAFNASADTCKDLANDMNKKNLVSLTEKLEKAAENAVNYIVDNERDSYKIIGTAITDTDYLGLVIFSECIIDPDSNLNEVVYRAYMKAGKQ